ncbi:MAG: hypothetical protein WAM58_06535 [Candidatus Acidiferrum sp.]
MTTDDRYTAPAYVLGHAQELRYWLPFQLDRWQTCKRNLGSPSKAWRLSAFFVFPFSLEIHKVRIVEICINVVNPANGLVFSEPEKQEAGSSSSSRECFADDGRSR